MTLPMARLLLVGNLRHGGDLDEVEVVKQADPENAEEDVDIAQDEGPEGEIAQQGVLAADEEHDHGQNQAETKRVMQVFERIFHVGDPPIQTRSV